MHNDPDITALQASVKEMPADKFTNCEAWTFC